MLTADQITDWTQDHMDALVTRAVRAEIQRDTLLRELKACLPTLRWHQETTQRMTRYENALAVVAKVEEEKNARS